MSFRLQCCSTLVLALMACVPAWSQGQELRYQFQNGGKTTYVMEQKQSMKIPTPGNETDIKVNILFEISQTVDSVDTATGTARLKQKYDRVVLSIKGPIEMEYDSKNDKEPDGPLGAMAGIFKAMTDSEIKMTMTNRGDVSDIKMPDKLIEEMKKQSSGNADMFSGMFSEDAIKNMITQSSIILPKESPVIDKTTWDRNMDLKMGTIGTMKNTTKYTYAGKSDKYDKINMKMDMKLEADPNATMQISMKTKDATGTVLFDNEKGRIQEMSSTVVSEMKIEPIGTMNVTQTMTMKVK